MGLAGTFAVQANGSGLSYQWSRNGSVIAGATAGTYTTGATAFSDSGSTFSVAVRNAAGSVTSNPATLTVTARAPIAGDLRFQQVDAPSTVNGYAVGGGSDSYLSCPAPGQGDSGFGFPGIGTSLPLINTCLWNITSFALPTGVTGLETGYFAGPMAGFQQNFDGFPVDFPPPSDPGSVVTSLSLHPSMSVAALGYIHSDTASGFNRVSYTVAAADLQATATQEGLKGHVVTAASYDGTDATIYSYGWTGDPSTVYEAKVVFTTLGTAAADAQALASEGYLITASGNTLATDGSGVILLGTRVQGDTTPRPMLVENLVPDELLAQGYAVVAVVRQYQGAALVLQQYIGER